MNISSLLGLKAINFLLFNVVILWTQVVLCKGRRNSHPCREEFFEGTVDHFNFADNRTFKQRFFTSLPGPVSRLHEYSQPNVVFFYTGNEADVELYVNATG